MDFRELYLKRRSTRAYTGASIPMQDVRLILEAGLRAPNACNFQSWHFYCITDPAKIAALVPEVCGQAWIQKTAFVVVITEDITRLSERWGVTERNTVFVCEDAGAAAQNMLLMATEMGYSGCFVGAFDEDKCRAFVGAADSERPVLMVPIGVPESEPPLRDRRPFDEMVTFIGEAASAVEESDEPKPFVLTSAALPNAKFDDLNLAGATFNNINLHGARFTDINLSASFFGGLTLENAYFGCVDLQNATFENPDLTGTTFKNCSFRDVQLENCNIDGMSIDGVSVKELLERGK